MTLWMRFAPRLRRIISAAVESAGARGCDEVSVEHILTAICQDEQSAASNIFEKAGISRSQLLKEMERLQPAGDFAQQLACRLSSATLDLLNAAGDQAQKCKDSHIGTEHVALTLAGSATPAGEALAQIGFTHAKAEAALRQWRAEKTSREGRASRRPMLARIPRWRRVAVFPVFAWKIFVRKSLAHPRFVHNPYPMYRWLRQKHPVRRDPLAPVWVISKHADVNLMLKDSRFLKDPFTVSRIPMEVRRQLGISTELVPTSDVQTVSMLFLDPPQHTRVRALFSRAFTPRMIAGLRTRIQQIMDERLAPALPSGEMELIETIAYPLPVMVIAELLGFPVQDYALYKKWSDDFTAALSINPSPEAQARATQSREELREYFDQLVEKIKFRPPSAPDSNLITALLDMEDEPGALSRDELFVNAALLLAAGHETTTNLIANGMLALLKNPEQLDRLRNDSSLIESAVEELLRFDSPVQWVSRIVTEKLELSGVTLEPGAILLGSIGAANRDELQFSDAEQLDIARPDNRHLSFGTGVHFCIGAALARLEAQVAILTLVQRLPNLRLGQRRVRWKKGLIFRAARELWLRFDSVV